METDYLNTAGKNAGEIARDIADFLSLPCVIHGKRDIDLAALLPDLNMHEQFSFALLMERLTRKGGIRTPPSSSSAMPSRRRSETR